MKDFSPNNIINIALVGHFGSGKTVLSDAILFNAGGYTHTSVAIADCIKVIDAPVTEVHISNIYAREGFRKKSLLSENCKAVICGLGLDSYKAALLTFNPDFAISICHLVFFLVNFVFL